MKAVLWVKAVTLPAQEWALGADSCCRTMGAGQESWDLRRGGRPSSLRAAGAQQRPPQSPVLKLYSFRRHSDCPRCDRGGCEFRIVPWLRQV